MASMSRPIKSILGSQVEFSAKKIFDRLRCRHPLLIPSEACPYIIPLGDWEEQGVNRIARCVIKPLALSSREKALRVTRRACRFFWLQ